MTTVRMESVGIIDGADRLDEMADLMREYVGGLDRDLTFQGIDAELADLSEKYAAPNGRALMAVESSASADGDSADPDGAAFGCVAYHRLSSERCELKRLYVRPGYRGSGAGRALVERMMAVAREDGYREMVLDTLEELTSAIRLYRSLGFRECAPYYDNPLEGALYMRVLL